MEAKKDSLSEIKHIHIDLLSELIDGHIGHNMDKETFNRVKVISAMYCGPPIQKQCSVIESFRFLEDTDMISPGNYAVLKDIFTGNHMALKKIDEAACKIKNLSIWGSLDSKKKRTEPKIPIDYVYLKAKEFQHFHYILNMTRGCIPRMEKVRKTEDEANIVLSEDFLIRIGIIGKYTDQNLGLLSKKKVKYGIPEDKDIWKESPLICFQNDLLLNSALKILQGESACHKILIKTGNFCNESNKTEDSIVIVCENKEQILTAITTCLEEPICLMLAKWTIDLRKEVLNKHESGLIAEIEGIRKQMRLRKKDTAPAISLPSTRYQTIVPENIKNFLFGRSGVNAFGIWKNSSFKVFVKLSTDKDILKDELTKLNRHFFTKYQLEIENGKLVEKRTLKQGDPVMPELPTRGEKYATGTLGGFVTKTDNMRKIYALTCNHVLPNKNTPTYAKFSHEFKEIGTCVFTTREKSCDFAAVKINESVSDQCDVNFRRDDNKKRNARVYTENLEALGLVHKKGAETDVTNGSICSTEFYNTLSDDDNRECFFLVKGTQGNFSEEGDSGALVFSRSMDVEQSYVEVVGMVYGNDIIVNDNDSDEGQSSASPKYVEDKKEKSKDVKSLKCLYVRENVSEPHTELSACFRIHTAIELLKVDQGAHFEVKFKDDVSSASSSDDSLEETA